MEVYTEQRQDFSCYTLHPEREGSVARVCMYDLHTILPERNMLPPKEICVKALWHCGTVAQAAVGR